MKDDIETLVKASTCPGKPTVKIEPLYKKILRRAQEIIKPTYAYVRYDATVGKWAVVDHKASALRPIRHFEFGVMKRVEFYSQHVSEYLGCGQYSNGYAAGVAKGYLYTNTHGNDITGFNNLSFDEGVFRNQSGEAVTKAAVLRLMPDRRSLYK